MNLDSTDGPLTPSLSPSEGERVPFRAGEGLLGRWRQRSARVFRACFGLFFLSTLLAAAQTNPPPGSYIRSYVNDLPDQPLVMVSVTGAVNIACFTIEEILPGPASALAVSGDGAWLPALGVIRWGPYTNTVATNVSYRLTGMPATYGVSGGAWMDGQWYFAPGVTYVEVQPVGGESGVPSPPQQVAAPVFMPASGAATPTNVAISCLTTGAVIYYTLDGSLPTVSSVLYTGPVYLATASVVRAQAFTNGWMPSPASVAYYGPPAAPGDAVVIRTVDTNSAIAPLVTLTVMPGTNAMCVTVTETLAAGLAATNVTAEGTYLASNNVVLWGPFFGTNAQVLGYQATGLPGTYPVQASWSVDGVGGTESVGTNLVIAATPDSGGMPTPPPQVATPVFAPPSGSGVPVNVAISCTTAGAEIYYTLDGSLPTTSSVLYTGPVYLAAASVVRARAFTNGWTPSVASVACYDPPAVPADAQVTRSVDTNTQTAPVVSLTVSPGIGAACVTVTEWLSAGLLATDVTAGGTYLASNNVVQWGPFFGPGTRVLSYRAVGLPGPYPVRASWSVDGVGGGEVAGTNLVLTGDYGTNSIPTPPVQVPTPVLSPPLASNLPVTVSISCSDPQAQVYFTADGSLPTQSSTPYTGPLVITSQTAVRARAFRTGYLPSVAAVGEYVPRLTTNSLWLVRSVAGNGTFLPCVTLTATPQGLVDCYAVTETLGLWLTPSGLSSNAVWNPLDGTIRWGPFLDNAPRELSYYVTGPSGNHPLVAEGSFDGYPVAATGATSVTVNENYTSGDPTNMPVCAVQHLTYNVKIDPAPGIITVTSATGTVDWGDGTQSAITQPVMTLEKAYSASGTYTIRVEADWTGYTPDQAMSGHATRTDTAQVIADCVPPQIVTQPGDQTNLVGATVQFTVSATSPFPMTYQWYFNQANPVFSPSAFGMLTLPNVRLEAAGLYSVVVTNAFGSVTSRAALLTLVAPLIGGVSGNPDGSLTLGFAGLPNSSVRLWAATNLDPAAVWVPIFTNPDTGPAGTWQYVDTNTVSLGQRYYRFTTP